MPKKQEHFGERAARSSSKNAKDKSNSATLRASQSGTHRESSARGDLTNRMLRCDSEKDSEKDSGYSEAGSDSVDDQRSSVSEQQRPSNSSNSNNSMAPYKEITPVYVIKNVMVKPSRPDQLLHSPQAWGGGWHGLTSAKGPTQVLLIQQPTLPAPSSTTINPLQNHTKKVNGRRNQPHKNSYLPILNSYPRIAPHPRKESHESKGSSARVGGAKESGGEGQSQSKRVCTEEEKREAVSTTTHLLKPQQHKESRVHSYSQHKNRSGNAHHNSQATSTTQTKEHHCQQSSDNVSSPLVSSSQTPSPHCTSGSQSSSSPPTSSPASSVVHSPYRPTPDSTSTRQRRFLNTAEILNQSGLLAITLRTKELLKQNAATEREIAQLRQHTQYLCQAAQTSQTSPNNENLEKLVQAMSESGSYPELDLNQLKALNNQQSKSKDDDNKAKDATAVNSMPAVISLRNIDDGASPPSPLFAPSPEAEGTEFANNVLEALPFLDSEQAHRPTEKDLGDLTMLPESSTNTDYLL